MLYAIGVRRLAGRGRRWPTVRSAAFAGAVAAAVLATQSGIARYQHHRFSVHMVQHVLLTMVVPLLLVLAAPVTLALQTARPRTRRALRSALHGPAGRLLGNPLVGWALFGGGLVALYLTGLLELAARHPSVHLVVHTHMLLASVLFLLPLLGVDPVPGRVPYPARLLALLAAVPFHTVVGMALLSASAPVASEAYPVLADQRQAAAIFWGAGEVFTLTAAAVVVRQWWRAEQRAATREHRLASAC